MKKTAHIKLLAIAGMLLLLACNRQGPMGPPGEPGPDGTSTGGSVISYSTPEGLFIEWEEIDGWQGDGIYELWINQNEELTLPDSVAPIIKNGGIILVYFLDRDYNWQRLPTIRDADDDTYTFRYRDDDGIPALTFSARVNNRLEPMDVEKIKVVVVPASKINRIVY